MDAAWTETAAASDCTPSTSSSEGEEDFDSAAASDFMSSSSDSDSAPSASASNNGTSESCDGASESEDSTSESDDDEESDNMTTPVEFKQPLPTDVVKVALIPEIEADLTLTRQDYILNILPETPANDNPTNTETVAGPVEVKAPASMDNDDVDLTNDIETDGVIYNDNEADKIVVEEPTSTEDSVLIEPASTTHDSPETPAIEDESVVVAAVAGSVETEEPEVMYDANVVVTKEEEAVVVEDTVLEKKDGGVGNGAMTPIKYAAPSESATATDISVDIPLGKDYLAVVETMPEPVQVENTLVMENIDAVVTEDLAVVMEDGGPEEGVCTVAISTQNSAPAKPAASVDASAETPVDGDEPVVVLGMAQPIEAELPAAVGEVDTVVASKIDTKGVKDTELEADTFVVDVLPLTEDAAQTEPAPAGDALPETPTVEDDPAVVEAVADPVNTVETTVMDAVSAGVTRVIEAVVVDDPDPEQEEEAEEEEGLAVAATISVEDIARVKPAATTDATVESPTSDSEPAVVETVSHSVQAEVVEDEEPEADKLMDVAPTPTDDADDSAEAPTVESELVVVAPIVPDLMETEAPVVMGDVDALVAREIEVVVVKDFVPDLEEEAEVAASIRVGDAAPAGPTRAVDASGQPLTREDESAVVGGSTTAAQVEESGAAVNVDAVVSNEIAVDVVEGAESVPNRSLVEAPTWTEDAAQAKPAPAADDSQETLATENEPAAFDTVIEPVETQALQDMDIAVERETGGIMVYVVDDKELEEGTRVEVSPTPEEYTVQTNQVAVADQSPETSSVEAASAVVEAVADQVETEEVTDDVDASVTREIGVVIVEDIEREHKEAALLATIMDDDAVPTESAAVVDASVGELTGEDDPAFVEAMTQSMEDEEPVGMGDDDMVVANEVETKVMENAENEADRSMVEGLVSTEDVSPTEKAPHVNYSSATPAAEGESTAAEAVSADLVKTERPGVIKDVNGVAISKIEALVVDDPGPEQREGKEGEGVVVVATIPVEDIALARSAAMADALDEAPMRGGDPTIFEAIEKSVQIEESAAVINVDDAVTKAIQVDVVEDAELETDKSVVELLKSTNDAAMSKPALATDDSSDTTATGDEPAAVEVTAEPLDTHAPKAGQIVVEKENMDIVADAVDNAGPAVGVRVPILLLSEVDSAQTDRAATTDESLETSLSEAKPVVVEAKSDPVKTRDLPVMDDVNALETRAIEAVVVENADQNGEEVMLSVPTPAAEAALTKPAAVVDASIEVSTGEDAPGINGAISDPVETNERPVMNDVDAPATRKIEVAITEEIRPEEVESAEVLLTSTISTENAARAEPGLAAGALAEVPMVDYAPAIIEAVVSPVKTDEFPVVGKVASLIREIEAAIAGEAKPEEEEEKEEDEIGDAAPAEPSTVSETLVNASTGGDETAVVEAMAQPVETTEPVVVSDVDPVMTNEMGGELVEDAELEPNGSVDESSTLTRNAAPIGQIETALALSNLRETPASEDALVAVEVASELTKTHVRETVHVIVEMEDRDMSADVVNDAEPEELVLVTVSPISEADTASGDQAAITDEPSETEDLVAVDSVIVNTIDNKLVDSNEAVVAKVIVEARTPGDGVVLTEPVCATDASPKVSAVEDKSIVGNVMADLAGMKGPVGMNEVDALMMREIKTIVVEDAEPGKEDGRVGNIATVPVNVSEQSEVAAADDDPAEATIGESEPTVVNVVSEAEKPVAMIGVDAVVGNDIEAAALEGDDNEGDDISRAAITAEGTSPVETAAAADASVELCTTDGEPAVTETMARPVEAEDAMIMGEVDVVQVKEIETEVVEADEPEIDELVIEAPTPTKDAVPTEPATTTDDSPEAPAVDGEPGVVEDTDYPEEAGETTASMDAVGAVMTREIDMGVVEDAEPEVGEGQEEQKVEALDSEDVAPAEPYAVAGVSVEPPMGEDEFTVTDAMALPVKAEQAVATGEIGAVVASAPEAEYIVEANEDEAGILIVEEPTTTEEAAPTEPAPVTDDSPDPSALQDAPLSAEKKSFILDTGNPAGMNAVDAVVTRDIEAVVVEAAEPCDVNEGAADIATILAGDSPPAEPATAAGVSVGATAGKGEPTVVEVMTEAVQVETPVAMIGADAVGTNTTEADAVERAVPEGEEAHSTTVSTLDTAPIETVAAAHAPVELCMTDGEPAVTETLARPVEAEDAVIMVIKAPTMTEDVAPSKPISAAIDPPETHALDDETAFEAVTGTLETEDLRDVDAVGAGVTRDIKAEFVNDTAPEDKVAVVVWSAPVEDAVMADHAAATGNSAETRAVASKALTTGAVADPEKAEKPEVLGVVDAVLTGEIEADIIEDERSLKGVAALVSASSVGCLAPTDQPALASDLAETPAADAKLVVVEAAADPVESERLPVVDDADAVLIKDIEIAAVKNAEHEKGEVAVAAKMSSKVAAFAEPAVAADVLVAGADRDGCVFVEAMVEIVEAEKPVVGDGLGAIVSKTIEAEVVEDAEPEVGEMGLSVRIAAEEAAPADPAAAADASVEAPMGNDRPVVVETTDPLEGNEPATEDGIEAFVAVEIETQMIVEDDESDADNLVSEAPIPTKDAGTTDASAASDGSPTGTMPEGEPAIVRAVADQPEAEQSAVMDDIAHVVTRDTNAEVGSNVGLVDEVDVVLSPIPAVDSDPTDRAAAADDSSETSVIEDKDAVVEAMAESVETEELVVIDNTQAGMIRGSKTKGVGDAEPEADELVNIAPILVEEASSIEQAPAVVASPEIPAVKNKATVVEGMVGPAEPEELMAVDYTDAVVVLKNIEAEVIDDPDSGAEEPLVAVPTPAEGDAPTMRAIAAANTPVTLAEEEETVVVQDVVEPVETGKTAGVEIMDAVVTKEIEEEEITNAAIGVRLPVVATPTPVEDDTLTHPAASASNTFELRAGEEGPAIIKNTTESETAKETILVDDTSAVLTKKVDDEIVGDSISEAEVKVTAEELETALFGERLMVA